MDQGDVYLWLPARLNIYPDGEGVDFNDSQVDKMKRLIGLDPNILLFHQTLNNHQRFLLKALAGPHGKVLAKAIEIKRGSKNG